MPAAGGPVSCLLPEGVRQKVNNALGRRTLVDEGFLHIQNTSDLQFEGKSFQNSFHHSGADPLLKAAMAGLVRRITVVGPRSACGAALKGYR